MSMSETPWLRRVLAATVGVLALALLAAGCGDDDDAASGEQPTDEAPGPEQEPSDDTSAPDPEGEAVTIIAEDIGFPESEYRVGAGDVRFVYENQGNIVHTLVIGDVDDFKLTVRSAGDVDEKSVDLEPGEYEMFCDIPGHRVAGMEAVLVVS